MASLVLGVAGAVVGFAVGGPVGAQVGFALGSAAGGILFPPKGPDGPRLTDLSVHTSAYGQGIPIPYGSDRVAGNVIWADKIQEHKQDHGGGSGGPTYTTYSYTCSFAVSIVAGPIAGILRIWADGLLIFDRSPTNTGETVGFKSSSYKIYLGDETQLPDPTIQSIIGDTPAYRGQAYMVLSDLQLEKFGNRIPSLSFEYVTSGSTIIPTPTTYGEAYSLLRPDRTFNYDVDLTTGHLWITTTTGHAYRDPVTGEYSFANTPRAQAQEYDPVTKQLVSYIDLPTFLINGQPQSGISGTMVASGGYIFTGSGVPGSAASGTPAIAYTHGLVINTETKTVMNLTDECSHSQFQNAFYWPSVPVPLLDNNKVYLAGGNGLSGGFAVAFFPASIAADPLGVYGPPTYSDYDPIPNFTADPTIWNDPVGWAQTRAKNSPCPTGPNPPFDGVEITFPDWAFKSTVFTHPNAVVVQGYGNYLALVTSDRVTGFDKTAAQMRYCYLPGNTTTMPAIVWDAANQKLWAFPEIDYRSHLVEIGQTAFALTPIDAGYAFPVRAGSFRSGSVVGATVDQATGYLRLLMFDGELILFDPLNQTVIESLQTGLQLAQGGKMWDLPGQAKVAFANGFKIYDIPYGSPLSTNPVLLANIVADLSERSGLLQSDIDVSDLTDQVLGFTITHQMAARSALEPLMQAFFFDPVESDYKIKFRKRGRPSVVTIVDDDLAAHNAGGSPPDLVEVKRKQETDLPQIVNIKYKNPAADYQPGTQHDARQVGRSYSAVTVDLPLVMDDEKAKQVAIAALYSAWAERTGLTFATSRQYAALEPTDMAIVHNRLVRIVHRKRNGGVIEWEAYADGTTVYASEVMNQGGVAAPAGQVGQIILATPLTSMRILDTPLLQDTDAAPGFYIAAAGLKAGWQGAQVWKSIDGGVSYLPLTTVSNASLMGAASNALGAYGGGDSFDEINTLKVSLLANGSTASLESATEQAVLNGANAALVGNEIIQYKRAVLNDDGTYTISGLLRYRRGTDAALHTAGERFVVLSTNLVRVTVPTSEIGLGRVYKAISNGGTLAEATAVPFTYTGADLKPYAPEEVEGWRNATGDLTITWMRRTRIGGEWRDGVEVPIGEAAEAYEVEVWNVARTALLRTITGLAASTVIYTAADQAADGITPGDPVHISIYQMSSVVGRGFEARGIV